MLQILTKSIMSSLNPSSSLIRMSVPSAIKQMYNSSKGSASKSITSEYEKLLKKTEQQMNLRMDGELSKEEFAKFYKPAEQQLRQIESQLPELQAEIDFLKIQYLSSDTILHEAKDLYTNWSNLPFEEKRTIVETITEKIVINTNTIDISLAYLPNPYSSLNAGNKERNFMGS